ncbi:LLM class flavin-dependent oxidoreductase [Paenibacillus puerhi]|uniref:LLM class flavin-dependent oxidoreductase n=1 Tax=Paenibacillus puerhi TaxID=2692622 RepID=UPI00135B28B3|nr:LLM class flavin-dependent oxidoreductase [Paenibacillus puerhi]
MTNRAPIKLSAYLVGTGMHIASWRHPKVQANASHNIDYYKQLAQTAERGKLDFVFIADSLAINEESHSNILNRFEPITLITALAGATTKIGVVATASTSYIEPFNLARMIMSVDHLSKGRAGWNIVTTRDLSGNTARNFGRDEHFEHSLRYKRAEEFVEVTLGLWDTWEDDAFLYDQENGRFYDRSKLHRLNHEGEFFAVQGPLNIGRSPQGRPILVQAGSSEAGQNFAAGHAEVIFSHKNNIEDAKELYASFKSKASAAGRSPEDVFIFQGISPILGETEAIAREKFEYLESLITWEHAFRFLTDYFHNNFDFSPFHLQTGAADIGLHLLEDVRFEFKQRQPLIGRTNPTLRELYSLLTGSFGVEEFIGTPEKVADRVEHWYRERAADGFMLMCPLLPDGLDDFIRLVVPLLQERGLFRTDYEGDTLREHLGLPRPVNRYAQATLHRV